MAHAVVLDPPSLAGPPSYEVPSEGPLPGSLDAEPGFAVVRDVASEGRASLASPLTGEVRPLLDTREIANRLGISIRAVRKLIETGSLAGTRITVEGQPRWSVDAADFARFLAQRDIRARRLGQDPTGTAPVSAADGGSDMEPGLRVWPSRGAEPAAPTDRAVREPMRARTGAESPDADTSTNRAGETMERLPDVLATDPSDADSASALSAPIWAVIGTLDRLRDELQATARRSVQLERENRDLREWLTMALQSMDCVTACRAKLTEAGLPDAFDTPPGERESHGLGQESSAMT